MAPGMASCITFVDSSGPSSGSALKPDNSSSTLTLPPPSPPETNTSTGPMQGITAVGKLSTALMSPRGSPPPLAFRRLGTEPDFQAKQPHPSDHLKRQSPEYPPPSVGIWCGKIVHVLS